MKTSRMFLVVMTALAVSAASAFAVIKPPTDIGSIGKMAKNLWVGEVAKVDAAAGKIELKIDKDVKAGGTAPAGILSVDLNKVKDHLALVQAGKPAVVITGRRSGAMFHVGDHLCLCDDTPADGEPWVVDRIEYPWDGFVGTTRVLVLALENMAKSKAIPVAQNIRHRMGGAYKEVLNVGAKPLFLDGADVDGDGDADLIVSLPTGVRLYLTAKPDYDTFAFEDATAQWGLEGAKGPAVAHGDVNGDGKQDLLIGDVLFVNKGGLFEKTQAIPAVANLGEIVAAGLKDATGDGKPDAVMLTRAGQYLLIENTGGTSAPWKGHPPRTLWDPTKVTATERDLITTSVTDGLARGAVFDHGWKGDGLLSVMVVRSDGIYCYSVQRPDPEEADLVRLSGGRRGKIAGEADLSKAVTAIGIRLEGRFDPELRCFLVLHNPTPDVCLANFGYGNYMVNTKICDWRGCNPSPTLADMKGNKGGKVRFTIAAAASGDFCDNDGWEEMVFATPEGQVFVQYNDNFVTLTGKGHGKAPQTIQWRD